MSWKSGNGYQLLFSGGTNAGSINGTATVTDPESIDLGEAGIWAGDKVTLGGVTPMIGSQDTIQVVKVTIPGDMAVVLASTSGNAPGLLTIINPAGSTATASAWVTRFAGPNYQPNSTTGNQKTVSIKLASANAILAGL